MVVFGAKFGWTFWPFLPRNPTFSCAVPSNCPELFARARSLEHCHSHAFLVPTTLPVHTSSPEYDGSCYHAILTPFLPTGAPLLVPRELGNEFHFAWLVPPYLPYLTSWALPSLALSHPCTRVHPRQPRPNPRPTFPLPRPSLSQAV